MTRSEVMQADIAALLKARNALLWIVTREELRVERAIVAAAASCQYLAAYWDCARGLVQETGQSLGSETVDPGAAMRFIEGNASRRVYIMRDLHKWLDPVVARSLKNAARDFQSLPRDQAKALIILAATADVPPELAGCCTVLDWPLPDRAEMGRIVDDIAKNVAEGEKPVNGKRDAAIDAALGLTGDEAANAIAVSLVKNRTIDPLNISAEKKRVISRERVLTWTDPDPRGLAAVGGLDNLKGWLTQRRAAFSQDARAYGLPAPKGVLLVGVPGCGKSLTAKAVAAAWQLPLLRLDMGGLRSKYVGDSEANIRKALSVAETVAPCVLWLDEIEKALAGATQGAADGGVSADALGTVLSWMQERQGAVFVVATANDISALPPELLRKGRFDDLFFVDLPDHAERIAVLLATLKQYGRDTAQNGPADVSIVAARCAGFTGAELAAIVPEALFAAYNDGKRDLRTADLMAAAETVVPLSKTAAQKIAALRQWAQGRARPASIQTEAAATASGRTVEL